MKKLLMVCILAVIAAGCGKKMSEAEKFGYKGLDLDETDKLYFTMGGGVTNWVPARVLRVYEDYIYSDAELAIMEKAGVIRPSEPVKDLPEGYQKDSEEPWFTFWNKDGEHFGRAGRNGFISHRNEDSEIWETGEAYFSSYYDDEASAAAAFDALKAEIIANCSPKKIHEFDKCFIAEYVRLRVMGVVGQKANGKWACMLSFNDKAHEGCGNWEPVDEQRRRVAMHEYGKTLGLWKQEKTKAASANHELVEKLRQEKNLEGLKDARSVETDNGRTVNMRGGLFSRPETEEARLAVWDEHLKALAAACGVEFKGEKSVQELDNGVVWGIMAQNEIYEVRLDMYLPAFAVEGATNAVEGVEQSVPQGEWRELALEILQPGIEIPPPPARPAEL